ncbi:hypothetical protein [Paenibacillus sp. XY044]|uniref:hypothetical protein n=1 Tax=Paenibacillus sp. XY044 TaxID=2026089 RepID=UPI000B9984D5|nr:hypothetical protein [Paenibacillus sp. XY044]OZB94254.1 hypothetical protein CJP46_18785 [Paenibacillus sp. XY044]
MKSILKVGLGVGIVTGVACSMLYYILCAVLDLRFALLNPVSIMVMSVAVNIIGAAIYNKLLHTTTRPRIYYGMITVGAALLLSLFDWAYPPEPDIAGVANTLHALVAALSIAWVPVWIRKRRYPN